jgi:Flp pilus assembly protein TadG
MSMRRFKLRRLSDDSGAEVVEFALIVPLLLLFITGLIAFGFVFLTQITITQAAREGARYAAICKTDATCLAGVEAKVKSHAPGLDPDLLTIDVTHSCATDDHTTVEISYPWNPGFSPFGSITIHGKASTPCGG